MSRAIARRLGVVAMLTGLLLPAASAAQEITVTFLGTGAPPPVMERFGPAILVEAGSYRFLFDAGRGALQRLAQRNVRWGAVDGVFFTHLHSDHLVGFPDLWLTGWLVGGGRDRPLPVWGPTGTEQMISHLRQAFDFDIRMRILDDRAAPEGATILARDIQEGVVFERDGVKVFAFEVDHDPVKPAFGYRVDFKGRSVVLSGDTKVSANLIRHAQGVDVLIHEVAVPVTFERAGVNAERARSVIEHHVTPEQAGQVFAKTMPRLAVYSHIVQPTATPQDILPPTKTTYGGAVEVAEDLMMIVIGKAIDVRRPAR